MLCTALNFLAEPLTEEDFQRMGPQQQRPPIRQGSRRGREARSRDQEAPPGGRERDGPPPPPPPTPRRGALTGRGWETPGWSLHVFAPLPPTPRGGREREASPPTPRRDVLCIKLDWLDVFEAKLCELRMVFFFSTSTPKTSCVVALFKSAKAALVLSGEHRTFTF